MASHDLIDAQFDRAVEIVQSLPKTGPIQTDYEEKLTMYSLFKQATVGNVKSPRPGIWDMLGRAKWDAWAKHKDLDPYEAKWLYVEALLKVLRKYSDKTVAMNLVEELESYGGDPSHIIMSRSLSKSPGSDASGSTLSEPARRIIPPIRRQNQYPSQEDVDSTSEDESADEAREMPSTNLGRRSVDTAQTDIRPQSSLSSHQRYRTPLAGSLALSPPPSQHRIPSQQPLPGFQTPSAFAESVPPSSNYPQNTTYTEFNEVLRMQSPPHLYHDHPSYGSQSHPNPSVFSGVRPPSAMALERAVENVQVHLAALTERIEQLESRSLLLSRNNPSGSPRNNGGSPLWAAGRGSPNGTASPVWDIDDLGMWSLVLNPLIRGFDSLREFSTFFARNENRSPSMIIIRRLCLDVSFLVCVIAVVGAIWRKSGVRRREVKAALIVLWQAIVGSKPQRVLRDQVV
ncbi:ACBP-domain-containing protein [Pholiota conissans]|uniref:ACBP-domain-containing protein n=1 Tax=Pholiota conissans TaxID=109636 RepID=A0A9P5YWL6_9AGAR|nr:ACBP-domain-containing protein [Pholiota conissans]